MSNNKNLNELTLKEKIESVISDYDDIASEYANEFYDDPADNKYIDKFLKQLTGESILDAGCGAGEDCKYVEKRGFKAIGIDFSTKMIAEAKTRYPQGNFKQMDMTKINYSDDTFDGIMANYSLFHIPTEQLPQVLENFSRVLKPNGKLLLILQEGNGEMMVEEPYRPGIYVYTNYFSIESISSLLTKYNFDIEAIEREETPNEHELGSGKLVVFTKKKC